nr:radical SAM family heme chaperone HemW [Novispirillum itersonii]
MFGLYIHWPYCLSKCPYCDFNSHVADRIDHQAWRRALLTELDHYAARTPDRILTSIFFGGGTPSLMAPETTAALIERARRHWPTANDIEITLEANPGAVDRDKFRAFRDAGVNRVSLGVQALDQDALVFLGRRHDREEALRAIESAAALFSRFSFDLIYARPGQTPEDWRAELRRALPLASAGHLSLYQLTIEEGTRFYLDHAAGRFHIPDDDLAIALWDVTQEEMEKAGMPAYEVSNHARPGEESRHNLLYWRGGEYVGIGPGAHGRICEKGIDYATRQHRAPEIWLKETLSAGHATRTNDPVSPRDRAIERVMMGLRLRDGIDPTQFEALGGIALSDIIDADMLALLIREDLIAEASLNGTAPLRVTAKGMPVLNAVIAALVTDPAG